MLLIIFFVCVALFVRCVVLVSLLRISCRRFMCVCSCGFVEYVARVTFCILCACCVMCFLIIGVLSSVVCMLRCLSMMC